MAIDWQHPGPSDTWPLVVLLWGDDHAAIQRTVEQIRHAALAGPQSTPGLEGFNHERFEGPYVASVHAVTQACMQLPMLAPRRLVELSDPDEMGKQTRRDAEGDGEGSKTSPEEAIDALIAYFEKPCVSALLVLTSSGINGNSRLVKAAKRFAHVDERKLAAANDDDAPVQIVDWAHSQGFEVLRPAAARLVELVGPATHAWMPALERAHAYAGQARVDVAAVEAVVIATREVDVFALTDALGRREATVALNLLGRIFAQNEKDTGAAMRLLGLLIWHFRRVFTAKVARDPAAALKLKPFLAKRLQDQAACFTPAELELAYMGLLEVDASFKGGSAAAQASPLLALQRWVLLTCGALPDVEPMGDWALGRL